MARFAIVVLALVAAFPANAAPSSVEVRVTDDGFFWSPVNAPAGAEVVFSWADGNRAPHTVTAYRGQMFDSGPRVSGSHTIAFSGEDTLFRCELHSSLDEAGGCDGMCGELVDDQVAPSPPVIDAPLPDAVVDASPVLVSGTADSDAAFIGLELADGALFSARVEQGRWELSLPLANGGHELLVHAFDRFWNRSGPAAVRFEVADLVAPDPPQVLVDDGGAYVPPSFPVLVQAPPDATEVLIRFGERTHRVEVSEGSAFAVLTADPGPLTVSVVAVDHAGNHSEPTDISVIVDARPPSVSVREPAGTTIAPGPLVVQGTAQDDHEVERVAVTARDRVRGTVEQLLATCTGCGTAEATWSAQMDLPPGAYLVWATAVDVAGLERESGPVTVIVL